MPLDPSLFSLSIVGNPAKEGWVDLVKLGEEEDLNKYYCAVKILNHIKLYDPYVEDMLYGKLSNLGPKLKLIELQSPVTKVELKKASISWEWKFVYEEHKYVWKREMSVGSGSDKIYILYAHPGKPDPDFTIAIYQPTKRKNVFQFLDYNVDRVIPEIKDRKGFEMVIVLSLLSFVEHHFNYPGDADAKGKSALEEVKDDTPEPLEDLFVQPVSEEPPRKIIPTVFPIHPSLLQSNEKEVTDPGLAREYADWAHSVLKDDTVLYAILFTRYRHLISTTVAGSERIKKENPTIKSYLVDELDSNSSGDGRFQIYLSRIDLDDILPNYKRLKERQSSIEKPPSRQSSTALLEPGNVIASVAGETSAGSSRNWLRRKSKN